MKGIGIIVYLILAILVGGYCTEYTIEYQVPYIVDKPVDVPFYACAIAGIFVSSITVPCAVITWLCSFVMKQLKLILYIYQSQA